jgi:glycosyltransferase involved in cell wall biosynthesis
MKILFVADGRSPLTKNWLKYFVGSGIEIHLVSTYPCSPALELATFNVVPVAFSNLVKESLRSSTKETFESGRPHNRARIRSLLPVKTRTWIRQWLGPYTLPSSAAKLKDLILEIKPNLIHAMRIPFEGMLTAIALREIPDFPFVVSVWGNDFTLHAPANRMMSNFTRLVMRRADALHTDTFRDQLFAQEWGYDIKNPVIVLPCAGGVDMSIFYPGPPQDEQGIFTIINPRGFRAYVRNDTFFRSIPILVNEVENLRFICPAMEGEAEAMKWVETLDIGRYVKLLPHQTPEEMAGLFRQSQITTSITTHDGTPNSLLEAMACGCFPIVGDIHSLREWISQDENGILVDPGDALQLADEILRAARDVSLRAKAHKLNLKLVEERAEYQKRMADVEKFYRMIVSKR